MVRSSAKSIIVIWLHLLQWTLAALGRAAHRGSSSSWSLTSFPYLIDVTTPVLEIKILGGRGARRQFRQEFALLAPLVAGIPERYLGLLLSHVVTCIHELLRLGEDQAMHPYSIPGLSWVLQQHTVQSVSPVVLCVRLSDPSSMERGAKLVRGKPRWRPANERFAK